MFSAKTQVKKNTNALRLFNILPKTRNQFKAFNEWKKDKNLILHGCAGTGKTYIACYLALKTAIEENKKTYIIRSTVPTRDIGYLPGNLKSKIEVYEYPYRQILSELYNRKDAYDLMKSKNLIEFIPTSFLRGLTFDNSLVIVDEVQNMSYQELDTIITRIGLNSKIIMVGDMYQDDLTSKKRQERSGLSTFMKIVLKMKEFASIEFDIDDIVRSGLVKSYLIEKGKFNARSS